jgi:deazaflavin-dependent oxidoreductase (nitroreductase family)
MLRWMSLERVADEDFCYVTTTGRKSRNPHTIEIWFGSDANTIYLLSGGGHGSDWVRNIKADGRVHVRIGDQEFDGAARTVEDEAEEAMARRLLAGKYQNWKAGKPLSNWARTALPVAIALR